MRPPTRKARRTRPLYVRDPDLGNQDVLRADRHTQKLDLHDLFALALIYPSAAKKAARRQPARGNAVIEGGVHPGRGRWLCEPGGGGRGNTGPHVARSPVGAGGGAAGEDRCHATTGGGGGKGP